MNITVSISRTATRRLLLIVTVAGSICAGGVVYADLATFQDTETLTAAKLNANFADLDGRLITQSTKSAVFTDWQRLPTPPAFTKVGGENLPLSVTAGNFVHDWRREGDSVHVRSCVTVSASAQGPEKIGMKLDGLPGALLADGAKLGGPVRLGLGTAGSAAGLETCFALWLDNGPTVGLHCPTLGIVSADQMKGRELCLDVVVPVKGWTSSTP